jgi:Restriction endonuclease
MPANTPEQWRLTELNQRIEQLEARIAELASERAAHAKAASRSAWRLRYLRLARVVRSPTASFELWPMGLLVAGAFFSGFMLMAIMGIATRSNAVGLLAFFLGAGAAAWVLASLLYRPPQAELSAMSAAAEADGRLAQLHSQESAEQLAMIKGQYAAAVEERRDLMASGQVQRAALLQREWKLMPEVEWEDFVVEVCRTLGGAVERVPRTTEKDANLLVRFANRSVAMVTKGEGQTVNSGAIQHALAGQKRHACDRSAVVINRRLTGAAQDFARHNGCTAIGVEEFPDFVMGKIEL